MNDKDYWGEDPDYTIKNWVADIQDGNTRMGYWEWVGLMKESTLHLNFEFNKMIHFIKNGD
jgi:hypothetical protein